MDEQRRMLELIWLVDCQADIAYRIRIAAMLGKRMEAIRLAWSWKMLDMRIKAVA